MVEDLTTVSPGDWAAGTEAVDGGLTGFEPGVPGGGVPVAVAVSVTEPLSRSAWVTV